MRRLSATERQRIERALRGSHHSIGELLEQEQIIAQRELALLLGEALHIPTQKRLSSSILSAENHATSRAAEVAISMVIEDALEKLADGVLPEIPIRPAKGETVAACPMCQNEVEAHFTVCPHCANALHLICSGCGSSVKAGAPCPRCGEANTGLAGGAGPSPAAVTKVRSFRALVVDDDTDLRRIVRATIERSDLGLTVITAQSAEEALELVGLERPDVVILDLSMPDMDGFEMCRRLRAHPYAKTVPVIVLTARGDADSRVHALNAGADDFIVKPLKRADFIEGIRRQIERSFGPAGPDEQPAQVAVSPSE